MARVLAEFKRETGKLRLHHLEHRHVIFVRSLLYEQPRHVVELVLVRDRERGTQIGQLSLFRAVRISNFSQAALSAEAWFINTRGILFEKEGPNRL